MKTLQLRDVLMSTKILRAITLVVLSALCSCAESDQENNPKDTASASERVAQVCDQALEHIEACVGEPIQSFNHGCDPQDAELMLETSCEVLLAASEVEIDEKSDYVDDRPFTCRILGLGCVVDRSCYESLSETWAQQVIELSDPSTIGDEYDVRERIERIAEIFAEQKDPRGIFAIVYRLITNNAVASVEEGLYEHSQWTRDLIVAFARRYLENLHGHFTGGEVTPQWRKYYKLAQDCDVGYGRTLGVAIATHLMVDLPYALDDVNSVGIHEEDFVLFGEVSLRIFPQLISDMQLVYKTDVSDLLKGFFLGDWIDSIYTKGTATTFIYQTVRINAWRNSQNFGKFPTWMVHSDITTGWGLAEVFLATLDAAEVL